MLDCLMKRREELIQKIEDLEKRSLASPDDATREKIDAEAWEFVARLELYRGRGPLMFFRSPGRVRSYLKYHERNFSEDVKNGTGFNAAEVLDEIKIALALVDAVPPRPF